VFAADRMAAVGVGVVAEGMLEIVGTALPLACPAVSPINSMRTRSEAGRSKSLSILMMELVASLVITSRLRCSCDARGEPVCQGLRWCEDCITTVVVLGALHNYDDAAPVA